MMDDTLLELQSNLPRSIRRRRKCGDYDAWQLVHLSNKLLFTCCFCLIAGWLAYPLGLPLLIFGGLLSLIEFPNAIAIFIDILKQRRLVRNGYVALGEVLSSQCHNFPDFGSYHTVLYQFVTDEGVEIQGSWEHADQPFWGCQQGEKFIIIYQLDKPDNHIAYRSALFEAVPHQS